MKMQIKNTLLNAIRSVFYNQKFVVLLWGTNSLLALVMTIPIVNLLYHDLGNSLMSDNLARGFDFIWFTQFMESYKLSLAQMPNLLWGVAFIYVITNAFYAGGLIAVFNSPKKNLFIDFFYGGVKYWLRFMKIVTISGVLYVLAFLLNYLFGKAIAYWFSGTESAMADFILRLLRYVILLFMIGVVSIISDYAKVFMALHDRHDVLSSVKDAALFIKGNFNLVFTVFFLVALLGGIGSILYNLIDLGIPRAPYYFLLLSFILQQMLVIFRLEIKMIFYSTEVSLAKELTAEETDPEIEVVTEQ